jgi:hypothetical protein
MNALPDNNQTPRKAKKKTNKKAKTRAYAARSKKAGKK